MTGTVVPSGAEWSNLSRARDEIPDRNTRDKERRCDGDYSGARETHHRQFPVLSQQMLMRTLKMLERDGMVERTVRSTAPPQLEYALTPLGRSLSEPVGQLAHWALAHLEVVDENR